MRDVLARVIRKLMAGYSRQFSRLGKFAMRGFFFALLFGASVLLFGSGGIAVAEQPSVNWSGAYIGLQYGWGNGRVQDHFKSVLSSATSADKRTNGDVGGFTYGYNWQTGNWVWGFEGDLSSADMKGFDDVVCTPPNPCRSEVRWFGTDRVRLGFAAGALQIYGTGGVAYGSVNMFSPGLYDHTQTNVGWTAGGGIEAALSPNWSVKAEYLRVDLGKNSTEYPSVVVGTVHASANYSFDVVRAGLNYRW